MCEQVVCEEVVCGQVVCEQVVCGQVVCEQVVCGQVVCEQVVCGRTAGGRANARTAGYRTKNKNPTQRCGEIEPP